MKNQTKGSILLFLTTFIWGATFVMQEKATESIGPFEFQAVRSLIGSLVLIPVIAILDLIKKKNGNYIAPTKAENRQLLVGGVVCGFFLCIASCLQQAGIALGTTPGKAGFITALYIIFVPILGLFLGKKVQPSFWLCILLALGGLYLLSAADGLGNIELGDLLMLLCALAFGFQILAVDHFAPMVDCLKLSCIEFFFSGLFSSIPMLIFEGGLHPEKITAAIVPILFAGLLSCGVAYTLQTVGQKYSDPAIGSLIMSFEALFAALTEAVIKWRLPSGRESLGCLLMLCAILLSQLPQKNKTHFEKKELSH